MNQPWRIINRKKATFFSAKKESDIHLVVCKYVDGGVLGTVRNDEGKTLYIGPEPEHYFFALQAEEEAEYAIIRAKVRAHFGDVHKWKS